MTIGVNVRQHFECKVKSLNVKFFEISHGSYEPLNFSPYLSLSLFLPFIYYLFIYYIIHTYIYIYIYI